MQIRKLPLILWSLTLKLSLSLQCFIKHQPKWVNHLTKICNCLWVKSDMSFSSKTCLWSSVDFRQALYLFIILGSTLVRSWMVFPNTCFDNQLQFLIKWVCDKSKRGGRQARMLTSISCIQIDKTWERVNLTKEITWMILARTKSLGPVTYLGDSSS